jgi:hypothetical protein
MEKKMTVRRSKYEQIPYKIAEPPKSVRLQGDDAVSKDSHKYISNYKYFHHNDG